MLGPEGWRRVLLLCVLPSPTASTKADGFRRLEVITGVGRRRRWSDEDKARIVAESLDPSNEAPRRWPGATGCTRASCSPGASGSRPWRRARVPGSCPWWSRKAEWPALAEMAGRIEIALGPAVVRVGPDVDAAALRRVLEAVRDLP